jgi:hypothetical protein
MNCFAARACSYLYFTPAHTEYEREWGFSTLKTSQRELREWANEANEEEILRFGCGVDMGILRVTGCSDCLVFMWAQYDMTRE